MNGKTFIDTNVLIYAHDLDAKEKHTVAKESVAELWASRMGFLSTQVLQEFYVNVTKKTFETPIEEPCPSCGRKVRGLVCRDDASRDRGRISHRR
jgi:predicted nucleic acid-binding protein